MYSMSGHSHWSTIKRKKAATDAKKSKSFSKLSRAITVAAKEGGGDPATNSALRLAIEKAKEGNMPKANIERAIAKGTGVGLDGVSFEEVVYEGYGPFGVAFMVKVSTDNKNRTVAEIRSLFVTYGGSLGTSGSAAYIFTPNPETPIYVVELLGSELEKVRELYEVLEEHDDVQEVYANFASEEGVGGA